MSQLAEPFEMSLPAVVQHLNVLRDAGLVLSEKAGRVRTCRINKEALGQIDQWMIDRRASWQSRLDRLGEYLSDE